MTNTLPKLIEKLDITDLGCWEWNGRLNRGGYGKVMWGGKTCTTHRLFYILLVSEIETELVLDHLCRNKKCCNPAHLEPVTQKENIMRGGNFSATNSKKTHCPQGHEFNESNTYIRTNGSRRCLTCHRESNRESRRKGRE